MISRVVGDRLILYAKIRVLRTIINSPYPLFRRQINNFRSEPKTKTAFRIPQQRSVYE